MFFPKWSGFLTVCFLTLLTMEKVLQSVCGLSMVIFQLRKTRDTWSSGSINL
jgi:hypothetical protein